MDDLVEEIERELRLLGDRVRVVSARASTGRDLRELQVLRNEIRRARVVALDDGVRRGATYEMLRVLRDLRIDVETTRARHSRLIDEMIAIPVFNLRLDPAYEPEKLVAVPLDELVFPPPPETMWSPTRPLRRARARGHRPVRARPGGGARGLRARRGGGRHASGPINFGYRTYGRKGKFINSYA